MIRSINEFSNNVDLIGFAEDVFGPLEDDHEIDIKYSLLDHKNHKGDLIEIVFSFKESFSDDLDELTDSIINNIDQYGSITYTYLSGILLNYHRSPISTRSVSSFIDINKNGEITDSTYGHQFSMDSWKIALKKNIKYYMNSAPKI